MPSNPENAVTNEPLSSGPLSPELLRQMNAYWRAANYLSVGIRIRVSWTRRGDSMAGCAL